MDALFNYGSKLTRDNQLIEDAIQDVFISLWNGRKKLTVKTTIRGYLLSSVRRQVIFLLKKKDNTRDFPSEILTEVPIEEKETGQLQTRNVLNKMNHLSSREREAILLKYYENLDYEEMSSVMGLQIHAIYKLVSRGIGKLRNAFTE